MMTDKNAHNCAMCNIVHC